VKIKRLTIPLNYKPMFHRYVDLAPAEPETVVAWVHCEDDTHMLDAGRALLESGEIVTRDEGTFS
jgi:hypothetical protein